MEREKSIYKEGVPVSMVEQYESWARALERDKFSEVPAMKIGVGVEEANAAVIGDDGRGPSEERPVDEPVVV